MNTITAKVNKAVAGYASILSKELMPYLGKTVTIQIVEIRETKPEQDATVTTTVKQGGK